MGISYCAMTAPVRTGAERATLVRRTYLLVLAGVVTTVLGCALGTVSSRLHRGHALLLERLRAVSKLDPETPDAQLLRCFT